jgi:splicing factor 3B subunit 1
VQDVEAASLSVEEQKEQKVLKLLLKIKNGTPAQRKSALRHLTDKARDYGPKAIFEKVLPLMMSPALEDQERHLLVKVMDRVLYKLDELVRPWVHKILAVTQPLLIDEDYYGRVEGREVISNLCKAAGLPTMFASIRPDIDHVDEYVRNCTARTLSVMAQVRSLLFSCSLALLLRVPFPPSVVDEMKTRGALYNVNYNEEMPRSCLECCALFDQSWKLFSVY